jgi:hypothetical protein
MSFEDKQFQNLSGKPSTIYICITGRPDRDTVIGKEDIDNLLIALNTTNDVTDFLEVIK